MGTKNVTSALAVLILFMLISSTGGVLALKASQVSQSMTSKSDDDHSTASENDDGPSTETEHDYEHEPEYERDANGTIWIQTDVMSVRLDDEYPSYQFWYTSDHNGSLAKFAVSYRTVVEFEDLNGDGVYQTNETIASVPLNAFDWNMQTGTVTDGNGLNEEVYVTYIKGGLRSGEVDDDLTSGNDGDGFILSDDNPDELDLSMYNDMTLQFYGHLYMDNYVGYITDDEGVQANYTISGGTEFKIDIEIGNFPFQSNNSKIAILNYLQEDLASNENTNYKFLTHEKDGNHVLESEDISYDHGEKFHNTDYEHNKENVTQELSLIEDSTNITRGFYKWIDRALMTLPNSETQSVDVGASYYTDGSAVLLFLAYPNFDGGTLMHDPSMKLEEQSNPVTQTSTTVQIFPIELGLAVIGVVAIIGIAAIALKKR